MAEAAHGSQQVAPGHTDGSASRARSRTMLEWFRVVAGTNLVILLLNFATGAISARVLGPAGKGVFAAVSVWTNVFSGFAGMGLYTAFISIYARSNPEDRPGVARALLVLACWWGMIGTLAVYLLEPLLIGHLAPRAAAWARLSSPLVALYAICSAGGAYLSAERRFGLPNWLGFLRTLLYSGILIGLAIWGLLNPYTQLALSWVLMGSTMVVTLVVGVRALPLRWGGVALRVLWNLSLLGWRYFALGLLSLFNSQLDQMIASAWLSAGDMGFYAVAISSLNVVGTLTGAIGTIMFPSIAGDSRDAVIERTVRVARRAVILFVLTVLFVSACAWPFVFLVYGRAYLPVVRVVMLIAPTAACVGAITVFYQAFYALRWFWGPTLGEGVGAGSGALLLWLLIPRWGLDGAAVATTISYALDLAIVLWYWQRVSAVPLGDLLPRRADLRFVIHQARLAPSLLLKGMAA